MSICEGVEEVGTQIAVSGSRLSASHQCSHGLLLRHKVIMWDQRLWVSWAERTEDYTSKSTACITALTSIDLSLKAWTQAKRPAATLYFPESCDVSWQGSNGESMFMPDSSLAFPALSAWLQKILSLQTEVPFDTIHIRSPCCTITEAWPLARSKIRGTAPGPL